MAPGSLLDLDGQCLGDEGTEVHCEQLDNLWLWCCVDTVGLLVDRTRVVVAGFNHTPTYQARGRGVRQWRLSCIQQECSIGDLTLSCTQTFRHSSSAAR